MVNIYIWGTGKAAKKVLEALDGKICDVKGFIDNNINISIVITIFFHNFILVLVTSSLLSFVILSFFIIFHIPFFNFFPI